MHATFPPSHSCSDIDEGEELYDDLAESSKPLPPMTPPPSSRPPPPPFSAPPEVPPPLPSGPPPSILLPPGAIPPTEPEDEVNTSINWLGLAWVG